MKKIVITDDSSFTRDLLAEFISGEDTKILFASSGEELIQNFIDWDPDLVLLDVVMPGIDGLETLKEIRRLKASIKVVICSAVGGQHKVVAEAMEMGAVACLEKPFNREQLQKIIEECV